jgi:hypothetical protein
MRNKEGDEKWEGEDVVRGGGGRWRVTAVRVVSMRARRG